MEWEIHVQVYPEQRFVTHRIEGTVEVLVVLILQRRRLLGPQWGSGVDDVVLVSVLHLLLILVPLLLLAKHYRDCHELAILIEQHGELTVVKKFLTLFAHVEDDVSAVLCLFAWLYLIFR